MQLKTVMQDRPDLIESELAGLAFDSCQQVFKAVYLDVMFSQPAPAPLINEPVHVFIDPAAGGPQSDYAVLSVTRHKGLITVRRAPGEGRGRGKRVRDALQPAQRLDEYHSEGEDEEHARRLSVEGLYIFFSMSAAQIGRSEPVHEV